jgi:serine/threonine protein kinase
MDAARAAMQPLRTPAPTRLSDVHSPTTASTNGGDISSRQNANQGPRRRTEIKAQTGTWQLQKTIGQGSMGKVKLARHIDNGEQVLTPDMAR